MGLVERSMTLRSEAKLIDLKDRQGKGKAKREYS